MTPGGRNLHRLGKESWKAKTRRKLFGKSEWFRKEKENEDERAVPTPESSPGGQKTPAIQKETMKARTSLGGARKSGRRAVPNPSRNKLRGLRVRTVMFVEQTKDGGVGKDGQGYRRRNGTKDGI